MSCQRLLPRLWSCLLLPLALFPATASLGGREFLPLVLHRLTVAHLRELRVSRTRLSLRRRWVLFDLTGLELVHAVDDVAANLRHHLHEQVVTLQLVLDERVLLRVPAQAHRLLHELDRLQVLLPKVIGLREDKESLSLAHQPGLNRLNLLTLGAVRILAALHEVVPHAVVPALVRLRPKVLLVDVRHEVAVLRHLAGETLEGPLRRVHRRVQVRLHDVVHGELGVLEHELLELLGRGGEGAAALKVELLALGVEHGVVVKELLTDVVKVRLNLLLRLVQGLGEHAGLDGLVVDAERAHERLDAFAAEDPEEVVLEGEEVAGGAGVALAAGAAAELVVDAAGLVSLGADDVEAAEADDLGLRCLGDSLELGLDRVERGADLERGFVLGGSLLAGK